MPQCLWKLEHILYGIGCLLPQCGFQGSNSLGAAVSSLKALFCSKNAINGRLLFQTCVWWKHLFHTNADSLGLTEFQSDNLSNFCHSLI